MYFNPKLHFKRFHPAGVIVHGLNQIATNLSYFTGHFFLSLSQYFTGLLSPAIFNRSVNFWFNCSKINVAEKQFTRIKHSLFWLHTNFSEFSKVNNLPKTVHQQLGSGSCMDTIQQIDNGANNDYLLVSEVNKPFFPRINSNV